VAARHDAQCAACASTSLALVSVVLIVAALAEWLTLGLSLSDAARLLIIATGLAPAAPRGPAAQPRSATPGAAALVGRAVASHAGDQAMADAVDRIPQGARGADRAVAAPTYPATAYAGLAPKLRELCERSELPSTSVPLRRRYAQVVERVLGLALAGGGEGLTERVDADRQAAPLARAAARTPAPPPRQPVSAELRERARGAAGVISERASARSRPQGPRRRLRRRRGLAARSTLAGSSRLPAVSVGRRRDRVGRAAGPIWRRLVAA
jgi:hypothetical protein